VWRQVPEADISPVTELPTMEGMEVPEIDMQVCSPVNLYAPKSNLIAQTVLPMNWNGISVSS
jgi:hypothetical protein